MFEELIVQGLSRLLERRPSITIAHRLATVQRADVLFVLDEDVVVQRRTHEWLLATGCTPASRAIPRG